MSDKLINRFEGLTRGEMQDGPSRGVGARAIAPALIRIYQLVLESQLPHKIVNLLFTMTNYSVKLTDPGLPPARYPGAGQEKGRAQIY